MDDPGLNSNGLTADEQATFEGLYGPDAGAASTAPKPGALAGWWHAAGAVPHALANVGLDVYGATNAALRGAVDKVTGAHDFSNLAGEPEGYGMGTPFKAAPDTLRSKVDEAADETAQQVADLRSTAEQDYRPDPHTTGAAGNLLFGAVDSLVRIGVGSLLTRGAGGLEFAAGTQGYERTQELEAQGVDPGTAAASGAISAGTFEAMGAVGGEGESLASRVLKSGAVNFAGGIANRGADSAILKAAGYNDLAAQEQWNDAQTMLSDALVGLAFPLVHEGINRTLDAAATRSEANLADKITANPELFDKLHDGTGYVPAANVDAALTSLNARQAADTAPGVPTDFASQGLHYKALDAAIKQVANGDDVYVDPIVRGMNTIPRPVPDGKADGFAEALAEADRETQDAMLLSGPLARFPSETPVDLDAQNFGFRENHVIPEGDELLQSHVHDESPERQQLRQTLIDERFADKMPVAPDAQPIAVVMGGGGASGKGGVQSILREDGTLRGNAVELDPDEFKTGSKKKGTNGLPEYDQIIARGDTRAAAITHAESDRLYQEALARAMKGRYNLLLDRTMSNPDKAEAELKALKDAGYFVHHIGVSVPVHEGLARASERSQHEPEARLVPAPDLIKAHGNYSGAIEAGRIVPYTDRFDLYDNFVRRGERPVKMATGADGALEIIDPRRYDHFVAKGDANRDAKTFRELYQQGRAGRTHPSIEGPDLGPDRGGDSGGMGTSGGDGGRGTPPELPISPPRGPHGQATEDLNPAASGVSASGPGEPLHPWTPVDDTVSVPYAGGVSDDGQTVYLDKRMPETVEVDAKTIDAKAAVVLHERTEWPLMHLTGPMDAKAIDALLARVGDAGTVPEASLDKLRAGEPLTYAEAHQIATLTENHWVRETYGVDPEKYQRALTDAIAKARKEAPHEKDIPADLDEKPYANVGEKRLLANKPGGALMQNRDRARAASLTQMAGIANAPDAQRLGFSRDPNTGAPMVSAADAEHAIPEADQGKRDVVVFADGRKVPVRYAVVDAGDVAASHAADGTVNPDYEGAPLQALNNGRVAGVQAAWRNGNADAYKAGLIDEAAMFGLDPKAIADKTQPMVIRLYDAAHNFGDMGKASNESGALGLSPSEQALTDARALPDLDSLPLTESGEISARADDPFHRAFLRNLGVNDAAKLVDASGRFNKTYLDRLRAALFARAYGDPRLVEMQTESTDPVARNVLNALTAAAPEWAKVDAAAPLGDYAGRITAAMDLLRQARESGETVAQKLAQGDLIARDHRGDLWAKFFADSARSPKLIGEALRDAARMIVAEQRKLLNGDLLGGGSRSESDITKAVLKVAEDRYGQQRPQQSGSLFNVAGRPARDAVRLAGDAATGSGADVARDRPREQAQGERAPAGHAADGQPAATAEPKGGAARSEVGDGGNPEATAGAAGQAGATGPEEPGRAAPDAEGRSGARQDSGADRDLARARQAIAQRPDLMLPEGLSAAEAMRQADEDVANAERQADAIKAAVNCFLSFGSDAA